MFTFYIRLVSGEYVEWRRLSRAAAEKLYKQTAAHQPENVAAFGWMQNDAAPG